MAPTDDPSPGRALLTALAAMAGVALLVGLAIGAVVVGAVDVSGVGGSGAQASSAPQSLTIPKYQPTKTPASGAGTSSSSSASPSPSRTKATKPPRRDRITLFVAPQQVGAGQRINLNGVYPSGEGAVLQVQRRESGTWTDFPVTVPVRGGSFTTWIETSRTGASPFRVLDKAAGRGSNRVVVTVG